MTRGRVAALAAVVLAAVAAGTVVHLGGPRAAYVAVRHPADEAAFTRSVTTYVGGGSDPDHPGQGAADRRWVVGHPDEVLAAGRSACDWLGTQPRAGRVEPGGGFTFATVLDRYLRTTPTALDPVVSDGGRSTVAANAWTYLCRAEMERRLAPRERED